MRVAQIGVIGGGQNLHRRQQRDRVGDVPRLPFRLGEVAVMEHLPGRRRAAAQARWPRPSPRARHRSPTPWKAHGPCGKYGVDHYWPVLWPRRPVPRRSAWLTGRGGVRSAGGDRRGAAPHCGRLVGCPRTFEHPGGLGHRLPAADIPGGFHRLATRARFASAIRFRYVRSSFPVAVTGISSRTTISSGALYPTLARANWISSWLAGRSVPSVRVM